jgi:hypothetical protein
MMNFLSRSTIEEEMRVGLAAGDGGQKAGMEAVQSGIIQLERRTGFAGRTFSAGGREEK